MFSKSIALKEIHHSVETSTHITSRGTRVDNLPKLISFSFEELQLPENHNHPLEGYSSTVLNKSYAAKLYLPKHIFLLRFEFDCGDVKSDALPKITAGQKISEEKIDRKSTTKQFLHRDKVEHQHIRRVTTECILNVSDLPLDEYLKTYGSKLDSVNEFLSIYIPAEKKIQRDLPLTHESEFNLKK